MAKKLILLMLVIPIIIMVSLYATTKTVSLAIDIQVSSVEIPDYAKFLYYDIDSGEAFPKVEYNVYPTNAANKKVNFSVEQYNEEDLADVEIAENGVITPKSTGYARINVITADGGFKDSCILEVTSNKVTGINITNKDLFNDFYVGESQKLEVKLQPSEPNDKVLTYESSDSNIVSVDQMGNVNAKAVGEAVVTVKSEKYGVSDSLTIKVLSTDIIDISDSEISTIQNKGKLSLSISTEEEYSLEVKIYDGENEIYNEYYTDFFDVKLTDTTYGKDLEFTYKKAIDKHLTFRLEVIIKTASGLVRSKECIIDFVTDVDVSLVQSDYIINLGQTITAHFVVNPQVKLDFEFASSNELEVSAYSTNNDSFLRITGNKLGKQQIKVSAYYEGAYIDEFVLNVLVVPASLRIVESANIYGLKNELVFGYGNNTLKINIDEETLNVFGKEYIKIVPYINDSVTNSVEVSTLDGLNFNVNVKDKSLDQKVTFKLIFNYENETKIYDEFSVLCKGKATNVSNYNELKQALNNKEDVVLNGDILDFPLDPQLNVDYKEIYTTYDYTYYTNRNLDRPKVKVLLEVNSKIFGNGYQINAHKSTFENKVDPNGFLLTNNPLIFKGPLDFAGVGNAASTASVKAQDNIVMALYDNAVLDNVEIKNCNNVSDLTHLNYVGTTVEVMGDNVSISYARLNNGRTVLRVFGDKENSDKVINVKVNNSILSNAREFIIRIGSNKFKDNNLTSDNQTIDLDSQYLDPNEKLPFPFNDKNNKSIQNYYENLSKEDKTKYDEKYIKTYLTLDNVALQQCGIFSIGLDSHFAGPALNGGGKFSNMANSILKDWHNMAKTSYGAKLILANKVNIYDWKLLEDVDSSTLIEQAFNEGAVGDSELGEILKTFKFDVRELVETISQKDGYKDIVYQNEYVHGGIAFFGGGLNYDVIEKTDSYLASSNYDLTGYQIGLDDAINDTDDAVEGVFKSALIEAAGNTDFYFYLCDSKSGFTPNRQEELINSGNAYDFIYA